VVKHIVIALGFVIFTLFFNSSYGAVFAGDEPPGFSDATVPVGIGTQAGSLAEAQAPSDPHAPNFLTLPFSDSGVQMTQAWICHFGSNICSEYNPYGAHYALDYAKSSGGFPVSFELQAAAAGTATCYTQATHPTLSWHYGNVVQINHTGAGAGYSTIYAHVASCEFTSRSVQRGERIGAAGTTGNSTGIHLHFELRNSSFSRVDPYDLWTTIYSYPQPGTSSPLAGSNHYWTTNPPSYPNVDTQSPTTVDSLSGTTGDSGWYRSSVQVTLSASDNSGGSGVDHIAYSLDGGAWQTYSGPVTVSGDGRHTITYRAQDNAGNLESEKQVTVPIDATAPTGAMALNGGAASAPGVLVQAVASAADATSGLHQMRLRNAGGTWGAWQAYDSHVLWQLPSLTGLSYTVEIQIRDAAGNVSPTYSDSILLDIYPDRLASAGYRLVRSTWGAAPKDAYATSYRLRGTAGQPSLIGDLRSSNYRLVSGYWSGLDKQEGRYRIYIPLIVRNPN
jgi:hypothetical protein